MSGIGEDAVEVKEGLLEVDGVVSVVAEGEGGDGGVAAVEDIDFEFVYIAAAQEHVDELH